MSNPAVSAVPVDTLQFRGRDGYRRQTAARALASQAGFRASAELPIANDFFRFYRLDR